ncbi:MAG: MFS transporter, partial [Flavobacteriales bacterium]|nr:MFS transporter [Flavobacteriales bacterium]
TLAFGFLVIAFFSPMLSAIADTRGNKKKFMQVFCYVGAASCCMLYFFDESNVIFGLFFFMLAGMGFYGSQVFYNSYLADISTNEERDKLSARGFTFGYIGSVIMQMIGFALVMTMEDKGQAILITFLIVGVWWAGFAQISFARLPDRKPKENHSKVNFMKLGFRELNIVWQQVKKHSSLKKFLLAFFFYSMGVQTVMLVAIDFGIKILALPEDRLIITAVIIQVVAIGGALLMSRLSGLYGNIRVLMFTVVLWVGVCVTGYFITTEMHFYILAALVGLVMGGIQSLSRSTYSKLMPETNDTASWFSFYDVTEKVAIVIGLFSFGFIEGLTGSMRNSIVALIAFFALGLLFLIMVPKNATQQHA